MLNRLTGGSFHVRDGLEYGSLNIMIRMDIQAALFQRAFQLIHAVRQPATAIPGSYGKNF
jgi:hypothetical protein